MDVIGDAADFERNPADIAKDYTEIRMNGRAQFAPEKRITIFRAEHEVIEKARVCGRHVDSPRTPTGCDVGWPYTGGRASLAHRLTSLHPFGARAGWPVYQDPFLEAQNGGTATWPFP